MRSGLWFLVLTTLALAVPAHAGTAANPEIVDDTGDSIIYTGAVIPHLEVTKGWIEPRGDRFRFVIEVTSMPETIDIPKNSVYIFHYSWGAQRLYWRANWTTDVGSFDFFGGVYAGCRPLVDENGQMVPPSCHSLDQEGNRQYVYFPPGNQSSLRRSMQGEVQPGSPGRISWSVPLTYYGENRENLQFTGIFVSTAQTDATGRCTSKARDPLCVIDTATAQRDYTHQTYSPWWQEFLPGPSPLLVTVAALGTLALATRGTRTRASGGKR